MSVSVGALAEDTQLDEYCICGVGRGHGCEDVVDFCLWLLLLFVCGVHVCAFV